LDRAEGRGLARIREGGRLWEDRSEGELKR
jgi:hypothetical protein